MNSLSLARVIDVLQTTSPLCSCPDLQWCVLVQLPLMSALQVSSQGQKLQRPDELCFSVALHCLWLPSIVVIFFRVFAFLWRTSCCSPQAALGGQMCSRDVSTYELTQNAFALFCWRFCAESVPYHLFTKCLQSKWQSKKRKPNQCSMKLQGKYARFVNLWPGVSFCLQRKLFIESVKKPFVSVVLHLKSENGNRYMAEYEDFFFIALIHIPSFIHFLLHLFMF